MKKYLILLLIFYIIPVQNILCQVGQVKIGYLDASKNAFLNNTFSGKVIDAKTKEPLFGAFVTLINSLGSYHISTDKDGKFEQTLMCIGNEYIKIEVAYLGYELYSKPYSTAKQKLDIGAIKLKQDINKIDEAVVNARRILFKDLGDSLVFFPANIKVQEGATILEALSKMPNIKATDTSIEVMGKNVEVTYVNGRAIFGEDNPMVALNNLNADQVSRVLAYDEFDKESKMQNGKHGRKRRVLNLVTFDFFEKSINARVVAGGGLDLNKNINDKYRGRYLAAANMGVYSEKLQITLDLKSHNALNITNGVPKYRTSLGGDDYQINHDAKLDFDIKLPKNWKLSATYSYNNSCSEGETIKHDQYFNQATNDLDKMYFDTTMTSASMSYHTGRFVAEKQDKNYISTIKGLVSFSDAVSHNLSQNKVLVGDALFSQTSVDNQEDRKSGKYSLSGIHIVNLPGKSSLRVQHNTSYSKGDLSGNRIEDSLSREDNRYILTIGNGENLSMGANLNYTLTYDKIGSFGLGYGAGYIKKYDYNRAIDIETNTVDSTITRNMTTHNAEQSLDFSYMYKYNGWSFSARVKSDYTKLIRDHRFPQDVKWNQDYFAVLPEASINYSKGMGKGNFRVNYNTYKSTPQLEMVSDRLTYSNPMFLFTGNPDLKQSYQHSLSINYLTTFAETQSSFSMSLNGSIINNTIGTKKIFYNDATYIPDFSYMAQPGAILTTYDNVGTSYKAKVKGAYGRPMGFLIPRLELGYDVSKRPSYVGDQISNSVIHNPSVGLNIMTNLLNSSFQLNVSAESSYINHKSHLGISDEAITGSLFASANVDFLKRMFTDVQCNYYIEHSLTQNKNRINNLMLNATLGCRIFKNRQGIISLTCNDLLNSANALTTSVSAERINTTLRARNSRYIILSLSYRFARQK